MEKANLDVLEKIISDKAKPNKYSNQTFLSVIQKEFYENYVSRILAYTLSKDKELCKKIIEKYRQNNGNDFSIVHDVEIVSMECEKIISNSKRIDVFVSLKDNEKKLINLIIENKICAFEHGQQTQNYVNWAESNKDCENVYIYLKPSWNIGKPTDKRFLTITYKELLENISSSTDYIILDFKEYIKKMEDEYIEFEDADKYMLNNYETIYSAMESLNDKISKFQANLAKKVKRYLDNKRLGEETIIHPTDKGLTYHFYKDFWYSETPDYYYFYVEIKYNSNLSNITFQKTIKTYNDDNKQYLENFLKEQEKDYNCVSNQWYVLEKGSVTTNC